MIPNYHPEYIKTAYIGPIVCPGSSDRIRRNFSDNAGPAYVPDALIHEPHHFQAPIKIEDRMLRPIITDRLWQDLEEAIEDQFEMRIAIFFKQALFLYNTRFTLLHIYAADAQVGLPGKLGDESSGSYQCAHMATIGVLRVSTVDNKVVAIGQRSSFHFYDNVTAWLPGAVNRVDSALDSQSLVEGRTFRYTAVCLLQYVSFGYMSPLTSLSWFLYNAYLHLEQVFLSESITNEKKYVIQRYVEVIRCYDIMLKSDAKNLLKKLCYLHEGIDSEEAVIYAYIQRDMHLNLIAEMNFLRRSYVALDDEAKGSLNPFFKAAIEWFFNCYPFEITKSVERYSTHTSCCESVQNAVRNFLVKVRSHEVFYGVLTTLRENRPAPVLSQIEQASRDVIPVKKPQKVPHILFMTLKKVIFTFTQNGA